MNRTFSIIKPDATKRNITGSINKIIEENNLIIVAQKRIKLSKEKAEGFYAIHKEKAFFNDLIDYMTSGAVIVQVLEGKNAVENYRKIMGATNPENAEPGTIRKKILPLTNKYTQVGYNPFFIAMGTTIDDFLFPEIILFGSNNKYVSERAQKFYSFWGMKGFLKLQSS